MRSLARAADESSVLVTLAAISCVHCLALAGCAPEPSSCESYVRGGGQQLKVTLDVRDEAGKPVAGAAAELASGGGTATAGAAGTLRLTDMSGPALVIVSAPGYLPEPVPIGWSDAEHSVPVRLLARLGGRRIAVHSVGDVMFGRRFEVPNEGAALIPQDAAAAGAEQVVASIRRAMAIADLRTVNLETVVSERTQGAYPGKLFVLRSRPDTLAGLRALAVNAVGIANNHIRDYMDDGIAETKAALQQAGLPFAGAAVSGSEAVAPMQTTISGTRVAMLAFTTVDGSLNNDEYAVLSNPPPSPLPPEQAFTYEARPWSYQSPSWMVPLAQRRIGAAWQLYKQAEPSLSVPDRSPAWTSLRGVYPEMQDYVARRGHGGALQWQRTSSMQVVQAAAQSADLVIVQLHGGFEFQEFPSDNIQDAAHDAIDAGADLVVCHHPHVLQGLEWYRGKLIAYSLGNFVFDQDFLVTFASAILRTVWDGKALVEARLIPIELVSYRPTPVTDAAAEQTLLSVWDRSQLHAATTYDPATGVRAFAREPEPQTQPAYLRLEQHTARVLPGVPSPTTLSVPVPAGQTVALPFHGLVDARLGLPQGSTASIYIGRDLFGWGRFEEETADATTLGRTHWYLNGQCDKNVTIGDAASGRGFLRLQRLGFHSQRLLARPIARVPITRHRLYASPANGATALDPDASYSMRLQARQSGGGRVSLRVELYHFDDTTPNESPTSDIVGSHEFPLTLPEGDDWQLVELPIPVAELGGPTSTANMVLFYIQLDPPDDGTATLDIDDITLIEWRPAARMPARLGAYGFVHNADSSDRVLQLSGLPMQ